MFEDANKYYLQENFFHMYVYSKINLFLFYVDEGFFKCVSVNHVCMLPVETRGG